MSDRGEIRQRIIDAASELLHHQGVDAVTTRAVSAAAGVQPPTIYRLFTDMRGLLDAVASKGFDEYLAQKLGMALTDDPVEDLRRGWDLHVEFGLERPAHYLLMFGHRTPARPSEGAERADQRLRTLVERVAEAGRLTVGVDTGAAMVGAAGRGVTLSLIATAEADRDLDIARRLRESTIGAVTGAPSGEAREFPRRAAGLKAVLGEADGLISPGERALLSELLDRLANA
ncbi:TetR/AcrR family transcriptional regulator [Glycomyces tarimensis]